MSRMEEIEQEAWLTIVSRSAVTCQPCESASAERSADWVVRYPVGETKWLDWFLCETCLDRWRSFGFQTEYSTRCTVEKL